MEFVLIILVIASITFALRVLPIWRNRNRGCDAYYYLLCVEQFKKKKRLPIVLPDYFALDIKEQWYPPGFPVFLSLFPYRMLLRFHWVIAPALDTLNNVLVMLLSWNIWHNPSTMAVAGISYALTSILVLQTSSLNSRPFGALFFILCLASLLFWLMSHSYVWVILFVLAGLVILFSHKLTTQALVVVALVALALFPSIALFSAIAALPLLAFLIGRKRYWNQLRGHYDILSFWARNWPYYGAHMVRNSPVYGDGRPWSSMYQSGWKGSVRHFAVLFGGNIFLLPALALGFYGKLFTSVLDFPEAFLLAMLVTLILMAVATRLVPGLRCFGEGEKYIVLTAAPVSLLFSIFSSMWIVFSFTFVAILIYLRAYQRLAKHAASNLASVDADLHRMFVSIGKSNMQTILCIPNHISEALVYFCRKRVVWGAHSDHFKAIEPYYPVLRKPLAWFKRKYRAEAVLLNTAYADSKSLNLASKKKVYVSGTYTLFRL